MALHSATKSTRQADKKDALAARGSVDVIAQDPTVLLAFDGQTFGVSRRVLMRNSAYFAVALADKKFHDSNRVDFAPATFVLAGREMLFTPDALRLALVALHERHWTAPVKWNFYDGRNPAFLYYNTQFTCVTWYAVLRALKIPIERQPMVLDFKALAERDDVSSGIAGLLLAADLFADNAFIGELLSLRLNVVTLIRCINAHATWLHRPLVPSAHLMSRMFKLIE